MSGLRLGWQLLLRRHGPLPWLALALLAAALALEWLLLPRAATALQEERRAVAQLERQLGAAPARAVPAPAGGDQLKARHDAFVAVLVPGAEVTRSLDAVFGAAAGQGVVLAQAEYKWADDKAGGFRMLEVKLPVKGPYPQVRRFIDATLAAVPAAALEEASFRRDGIGAAAGEARLRFTLFVREAAP